MYCLKILLSHYWCLALLYTLFKLHVDKYLSLHFVIHCNHLGSKFFVMEKCSKEFFGEKKNSPKNEIYCNWSVDVVDWNFYWELIFNVNLNWRCWFFLGSESYMENFNEKFLYKLTKIKSKIKSTISSMEPKNNFKKGQFLSHNLLSLNKFLKCSTKDDKLMVGILGKLSLKNIRLIHQEKGNY